MGQTILDPETRKEAVVQKLKSLRLSKRCLNLRGGESHGEEARS